MRRLLIPAFLAAAAITYAVPGHAVEPSRVQHACSVVMGLNTSELPYDVCVSTLQQMVTPAGDTQAVDQQRQACLAKGMQPGTADFALCALRAQPAAATTH